MAFDLSFAAEFFIGPYDFDTAPNDPPTSVYQALQAMSAELWAEMCEEVFPGIDPDFIDCNTVMDKIRETDTCTDLRSPVEVWIDREGYFTVEVH